jgi:hypothetical protein
MSDQSEGSGTGSAGAQSTDVMKNLQAVLISHSSVGLTEGLQTDESDDEFDPFSMMADPPPQVVQPAAAPGRPALSADDQSIIVGDEFDDELKGRLATAIAFAKTRADAARALVKLADDAFDRVNGHRDRLTDAERAAVDLVIRWFGGTWTNSVPYVCKVYADISAQAEMGVFKRYGGGGSGKLLQGVVGNTTFAYTAFGAGGGVYLAAKFWDELSAERQGYCVLHEMAHWVDGAVLDVSTGAGGKPAALDVAVEGSAHAMTNAYCYQFFAEEM